MMGYVFIFSMVVMMIGFSAIFFRIFSQGFNFMQVIYSALAALLFMIYLAIDIQVLNLKENLISIIILDDNGRTKT